MEPDQKFALNLVVFFGIETVQTGLLFETLPC